MHLIGFSHDYTKLHGQTYGTLVSVRSTKLLGNRPDNVGINYDTEFLCLERGCDEGSEPGSNILILRIKGMDNYPLKPEDFDNPMLQLVFIGAEHQIPFTTYREFPKDYKPFYPMRMQWIPYSDLIGEEFAFKFKGEELPENLANRIYTPAVKIFY